MLCLAIIFLTITVLWLDSRSVERVAMASVNFICHLLCIFDLQWQSPYNGVNPPNISEYQNRKNIIIKDKKYLTLNLKDISVT